MIVTSRIVAIRQYSPSKPVSALLRCRALEVLGVVRVARTFVLRDLRIWAEWPRHHDLALVFAAAFEPRRRLALLHPARERTHPVRLVRGVATSAVTHAR